MINLYRVLTVMLMAGLATLPASARPSKLKRCFGWLGNPQSSSSSIDTPEGFCLQLPNHCKPEGLFSLVAPIVFNAKKPIRLFTDPRQGGMAKDSDLQRIVPQSGTDVLEVHCHGIGHEAEPVRTCH